MLYRVMKGRGKSTRRTNVYETNSVADLSVFINKLKTSEETQMDNIFLDIEKNGKVIATISEEDGHYSSYDVDEAYYKVVNLIREEY